MARHIPIRDRLEQAVWRDHPQFAQRHANQRAPRRRAALAWQDRVLFILAAALLLLLILRVEAARADAGQAAVTGPFWGIEAVTPGGAARSIALDTDMVIEVTGLAARVEVTQVFRNDGAGWREAVYRFPLPPGAAVDRLRIEADDRVVEGEIREKTEARRQYQQARTEGRLASLVEQQRVNQFETRLANIAPGATVRVAIGFLAQVDYRDGQFGLSLPLTFTPRWESPRSGPAATEASPRDRAPHPLLTSTTGRDDHRLTLDLLLHSGVNLASLESRHHDIDVHPTLGGYRVFLADPDTRSDRVFELNWTPDYGQGPIASLETWDGGDSVYALLMLAPPLAEALAPRPREVVFVIDTSGSMEGVALDQARRALRQGLDFLGPEDRFNLVRFHSEADLLFEESAPVYPAELEQARDFVGGLVAAGGTDMAPALRLAMGLPAQDGLLRQIVFITDGSVGNEEDLLLQVAEQLGDSRLFTVSIGAAPNTWFMRKAAAVGRGSHTHIGKQADVAERMAALWSRIQNPAVQNLNVDWGMEAEFYPEIIPDLYAGEPLWLYAKLPHPPRNISVFGELDGRDWETIVSVGAGGGGEEIATLWARGKIESLQDSRIFGIGQDDIRRQVLGLALEFGLLTPYTSLVAVDRTPSRPAAAGLESEGVPGLLPAGSTAASGFPQTATGWPLRLGLALLALFLATAMLLGAAPSRARSGRGARPPAAALPG
jgi:Ca-activated chloride channel family protein